MKQKELAQKIGCVQSHLSMIINGVRKPSWNLAKRLAELLNTTPDFWYESTPEEKRKALEEI